MDHFEERLLKAEMQIERLVSNAESEKGTRARFNDGFEARLRALEIVHWRSSGVIAVIVVVAQVLISKFVK